MACCTFTNSGRLVIDDGAVEAIKLKHRSLLPVGVKLLKDILIVVMWLNVSINKVNVLRLGE